MKPIMSLFRDEEVGSRNEFYIMVISSFCPDLNFNKALEMKPYSLLACTVDDSLSYGDGEK
jgi:hypothetical protein